jgi:NAD dependent epimerase/dehydratase
MSSKIAVTGAGGFIGSHLAEMLVTHGYRVRAMVEYNSASSWGCLEDLDPELLADVEVVLGDVRDPDSVFSFMEGVDAVCHLAALIAIPYSYQAPGSYLATNAGGTLNVLQAARRLGTARVILTSTSEVYGTALSVPITENHPLQAQSPYAASKIAADKLGESYHLSFGVPLVTLRPFNTYGPRQSARAVIPSVVSQLAAGQRVIALGALEPTRDFNFVQDTAAAFEAVLRAPEGAVLGRVFNAGSGREISVRDTVHLIAAGMGCEVEVILDRQRLRPKTSEVMRLVCDSTELHKATAWVPAHTLEEGLKITSDWFQDEKNLARYKTASYNV